MSKFDDLVNKRRSRRYEKGEIDEWIKAVVISLFVINDSMLCITQSASYEECELFEEKHRRFFQETKDMFDTWYRKLKAVYPEEIMTIVSHLRDTGIISESDIPEDLMEERLESDKD